MAAGETFETDRKLDITAANDILNLEVGEFLSIRCQYDKFAKRKVP